MSQPVIKIVDKKTIAEMAVKRWPKLMASLAKIRAEREGKQP